MVTDPIIAGPQGPCALAQGEVGSAPAELHKIRPAGGIRRESICSSMCWIPGGTFRMGAADGYPEEAPVHTVSVSGFWMDPYTVTNAEFAGFVAATGYRTVAERPLDPA